MRVQKLAKPYLQGSYPPQMGDLQPRKFLGVRVFIGTHAYLEIARCVCNGSTSNQGGWCRGGNRYVEGVARIPLNENEKSRNFIASWFLGVLLSSLLDVFVS